MQIATENIDERNPDGPSSPKARLVIVQGKQRVSDTRSSKYTSVRSIFPSSFNFFGLLES